MAEIKTSPGDYVKLRLAKKEIEGTFLESYDKDIVLLKLKSGYNIGISKENILDSKIIRKFKEKEDDFKIPSAKGKPSIGLVVTGGTIASKLDPRTGGVRALTDIKEFARLYPILFEKCDVRLEVPFMAMSEDMNSEHWKKIAGIVKDMLNDKEIVGVIITHGSDTLHYTSAALSFFLRDLNKPVVLTFSQRSVDRASSDAELNMQCAAQFALSDCAEVVIVGHASTNDDFCYALSGTKVRKMHTSRRDTFKPINVKPIAKIFPGGEVEFLSNRKPRNKEKVKLDDKFNDKVALVKFYPGQNPEIFDYYTDKGYKGLVIEMTGLGHVTVGGKYSFIPKIKKLVKEGILIFGVAQTLYGSLNLKVYSNQREIEKAGLIGLKDILPETAFVKLGWVLGHREWRSKEKVKEKMLENVSGEFNELLTE